MIGLRKCAWIKSRNYTKPLSGWFRVIRVAPQLKPRNCPGFALLEINRPGIYKLRAVEVEVQGVASVFVVNLGGENVVEAVVIDAADSSLLKSSSRCRGGDVE